MPLVLSEEQELLRQTARELLEERAPVAAFRLLRDSTDPVGFSRELWKELAELGWAGIPFPEEYGGAGLGMLELGIVLEECGRTLAATPLVSSVLVSGSAVLLAGSEAQRKEVLSGISRGDLVVAPAFQEGPHHDPYRVATRAEVTGGGFRLSGQKVLVPDGHVADRLLVLARTAGSPGERDGLVLLLVDRAAPGVSVTRTIMVDGRNAARIELQGVTVPRDALLGEPERGAEVLDPTLDRAAAGLAAEMLGGMDAAFERTLRYLKERVQFGAPIGSFQALKHRAARMFVEIELSRSSVLQALQALDSGRDDAPRLASVAKAQVSDTSRLVALEGVQMHGGIGVTDEEDIGLYLKRARVAEHGFGNAGFHRDRVAALEGY